MKQNKTNKQMKIDTFKTAKIDNTNSVVGGGGGLTSTPTVMG